MLELKKSWLFSVYSPEFCSERLYTSTDSDLTQLLDKVEYTPKKGDKIFVMPNSSIPRFKSAELTKKYGIKFIRNIDKADYITGSDRSLASLNITNTGRGTRNIFAGSVKSGLNYTLIHKDRRIRLIASYYTALILSQSKYHMLFDYYYNKNLSNGDWDDRVNLISDDVIKYRTFKFIHNDDINKLLNTDTIITEESYANIKRLFESSEKENTDLAMEIMANCNYVKSSIFILLLVRDYAWPMSNSKIFDSVNFKALKSFFNIKRPRRYHHYNNWTLTEITAFLKNKNIWDDEIKNILVSHIKNDVSTVITSEDKVMLEMEEKEEVNE